MLVTVGLAYQIASNYENRADRMKHWKMTADNFSKAGWSLGWVSAVDSDGRTIWIADAHRDRKRYVVRGDEKLTDFVELQSAISRTQRLTAPLG